MPPRLPDFIVIGAMKAGTTTAFEWLAQHPETTMPAVKEPNFFCHTEEFARGLDKYGSLFAHAPINRRTGEASVNYTHPDMAATSAKRIASTVPNVRLIAILRDPVERLRSHYRHRVQRGFEHRSLAVATSEPGNVYVGRSQYYRCLSPYWDVFDREALLVVRTEDMHPDGSAWPAILDHLGLSRAPAPTQTHNATDELQQMNALGGVLSSRRVRLFVAGLPGPLRRFGRAAATRGTKGDAAVSRRAASEASLSAAVINDLGTDAEQLRSKLGWDRLGWPTVEV